MGKLTYIQPLDGFRGFFCILIVAYHWPMQYLSISFGWEVLQTFYVISGYLITRILLYDKSKNPGFKDFYYRFFYRRSFRIFPLYFAFIGFWTLLYLIGYLSNAGFLKTVTEEVGRNGAYLYTYLYNFMGFFNHFRGVEFEGSFLFGHLWSLSLEEQFYLSFPLAVFLLSERNLKRAVIAIIILAPLLRYVGYDFLYGINPDHKWVSVNMYRMAPFQADSFAIGCLLALTGFERIKKPVRFTVIFLAGLFLVYVANRWYVSAFQGTSFQEIGGGRRLEQWLTTNYQHVYLFTLVNFGAAFIVMCFERGHHLIPQLFNNKLMAYFGKISYGIYVYHVPLLFFWLVAYSKLVPQWVAVKFPFWYELAAWIPFWALVLGFSHLSYYYFEEYFLRLKEKIDAKKFAKLHEGRTPKPE
jgi:peptidoglycan/LPS O-acetylase OafA/YrhL